MGRESAEGRQKQGRERWSRETGTRAVEGWRRSGEELGAYCRGQGLRRERLAYWVKALAMQSGRAPGTSTGQTGLRRQRPISFVPVVVRERARVVAPMGGTAGEAVSPEWAARFVRALFGGEQ